MEIATNNQSILTTHLQPLVPGAMLYPGRCSVWQPVPVATNTTCAVPVPVAVPTAMAEVPKESIIANTDFTTTSLIAKRRLSSKKRRMQHQNGSTGSDISTEGSTHSPISISSANGSPAVGSSMSTPMLTDKNDEDPFSHKDECSRVVTTTTAATTVVLPQASSHSGATSTSYTVGGSGPYMTVPSSTHPVGLLHNQVANPVLSQLQQELNYRFLQEQSLLQQCQGVGISGPPTHSTHIEHPHPLTDHVQRAPDGKKAGTDAGSGFKWCVAHVMIAKQIQYHKQQQNDGTSFHVQEPVNPVSSSSSSFQSPPRSHTHNHTHTPPSLNSTPVTQAQQQQQKQKQQHQPVPQTVSRATVGSTSAPSIPHLALMQYSHNSTAPGLPPGYLALPYTSLQDMQLRMHPQPHQSVVPMPAHVQLSGGIPMVKPMTMADSVVGGINPSAIQMVGGVPLQQAHHLTQLPVAAAAAHNPNTATIVHAAPSAVGSWVTPVPVVNSCIVSNPFQPGVMAAPWVK